VALTTSELNFDEYKSGGVQANFCEVIFTYSIRTSQETRSVHCKDQLINAV
jgi:hypothetical protein